MKLKAKKKDGLVICLNAKNYCSITAEEYLGLTLFNKHSRSASTDGCQSLGKSGFVPTQVLALHS